MSTTITAPSNFTGPTAIGPTVLDFKDGTATTDVALSEGTVAYLRKRGYTVSGSDVSIDTDAEDFSFDKLTVPQLREYATEHGIDLEGATKKADIVAVIEAAPSDEDDDEGDKDPGDDNDGEPSGTANVGGAQ